jgi:hypothetical protein
MVYPWVFPLAKADGSRGKLFYIGMDNPVTQVCAALKENFLFGNYRLFFYFSNSITY